MNISGPFLTADYHEKESPLESLQVIGTVVGWRADGTAVVASPVDYLVWSEGLDGFSSREEFEGKGIDVHIAGRMSDKAISHLKKRGWKVTQNSGLFWSASARSGQVHALLENQVNE